jgi:hypothetical protein
MFEPKREASERGESKTASVGKEEFRRLHCSLDKIKGNEKGGKNEGQRPHGRLWRRWENYFKWILNKWNGLLQIEISGSSRLQCRAILNVVMKFMDLREKRPLGRPWCRWEDNIKMDLK